jgi:glycogen operon protein
MGFGDFTVSAGKAMPLGASIYEDGVNFAVFSRHATMVTLILFESPAPDSPHTDIPLNTKGTKTGDIWHCHVKGLKAGACYLYRVDGP